MLHLDKLMATYSKEEVLVILITRVYFAYEDVQKVHDFISRSTIDWDKFYELITLNTIRGFIYEVITDANISIDTRIYDNLKKDAMRIRLVASYHADLTGTLTKDFENMGITVIPYKGYTLATRYYKTPYFREGSDLDFLVSKDDIDQLRAYLEDNGLTPKFAVSAHQMDFVIRFHRELAYAGPRNKIGISCSVEIKWKLLENYFHKSYDYEFFVKHLETYTSTDGSSLQVLTPTYNFIAVSYHHLIKEPLLKFKYLVDLACIIQTSAKQLDWKIIDSHFKENNFSPFLGSGINALQDIIGFEHSSVLEAQPIPYHLFTVRKYRSVQQYYYMRCKLVNAKLSLSHKLRHSFKVYLALFVPNLKDLSQTKAPSWTIPMITPVKCVRFFYQHIVKKKHID